MCRRSVVHLAAIVVVLLPAASDAQVALGTAISYQGRLTDAGAPASGSYDLQFTLFNALTGGAQVGSVVTATGTTVTAGVFTVSLDFGGSAFGGNARWLEVGVRPGGTSGAFTILMPRQALLPAAQTLYAPSAGTAAIAFTATQLANQPAFYYLMLANQTGTLSVAQGGTGGTSASAARTSLGAAASGANNDITSLTGLSTPLTVAQGGTGATTVAASPFLTKSISACPLGSGLQAINSDGTVVCETAAARSGSAVATLDGAGDVGLYSSITIGADGLGLISYYDFTNGNLKVAHCGNTSCSPFVCGQLLVNRHTAARREQRVDKAITLATPHKGTRVADPPPNGCGILTCGLPTTWNGAFDTAKESVWKRERRWH